jgi:hypothetical protein
VNGRAEDTSGNAYVVGQVVTAAGTENVNGLEVITAETDIRFISVGGVDNYVGHVLQHIMITPSGITSDLSFANVGCRG